MNSRTRSATWTSQVRKAGRIDLPPTVPGFHLGQRIYFHVTHLGAVLGIRPTRTVNGRLLSTRIRRGLRSIGAYGPRAPNGRVASQEHRTASDLVGRSAPMPHDP